MRNAVHIIDELIENDFNVSIDISPRWHVESKTYRPYARVKIGKGLRTLAHAESFDSAEAVRQVSEEAREKLREINEGWR